MLIVTGSLIMIAGAVAISFAEAPDSEQRSWRAAMERECARYGLDRERVARTAKGEDPLADERPKRRWWELVIVAAALALFVWLAAGTQRQPIPLNVPWMVVLVAASVVLLVGCGVLLWRRTRFS
jgi:hypothetical protein